jgi:hypothetical protein
MGLRYFFLAALGLFPISSQASDCDCSGMTVSTLTVNYRLGIGTSNPDRALHIITNGNPLVMNSTFAGNEYGSGRIMMTGMTVTSLPSGPSANGDFESAANYGFKNSAGNVDEFAEEGVILTNRTVGSEEAHLVFLMRGGGATLPYQNLFRMMPIGSSGASLRFGPPEYATAVTPGGGGFLYSTAPGYAGFATAQFNGANFVARDTSACLIEESSGGIGLYVNTGLTVGNSFSPTLRMSVAADGLVTIPGQLAARGTVGADDAWSGYVGEAPRGAQLAQANFPSSGVYGDGTSIFLAAGDWDITAQMAVFANGSTFSRFLVGISSSSGNTNSYLQFGDNLMDTPLPVNGVRTAGMTIAGFRVKQPSSATFYLKVYSDYSAGTPQYTCRLSARRPR